jgi:hypothetical protein
MLACRTPMCWAGDIYEDGGSGVGGLQVKGRPESAHTVHSMQGTNGLPMWMPGPQDLGNTTV